MKTLEEQQIEYSKGKIFCGQVAFETIKKALNILHGNEIKHGDVTFVLKSTLAPPQIVAFDPEMVERLKAVNMLMNYEKLQALIAG